VLHKAFTQVRGGTTAFALASLLLRGLEQCHTNSARQDRVSHRESDGPVDDDDDLSYASIVCIASCPRSYQCGVPNDLAARTHSFTC
jgi:hypothetical protein